MLRPQVVLVQGEALEEPAQGYGAADALLELIIPRSHLARHCLL